MLNPLEPQNVQYCIPIPVRDEQIRLSLKRIKKRLVPNPEIINEPIAVVTFGPSLKKTWQEIKKFKYVISCSGAYKFLVDRGIIPDYHVEVDPRPHKVQLIGQPQQKTKFLIASCCHPKVFNLLENYDVAIWHVFSTEEESFRILPRGEWSITGGSSVGLRTMTMARFLGFTNLHIFGMDGSFDEEETHASYHPNSVIEHKEPCEYNGKTFYTTIGIMECARQTFHELDQMPDVNFKFYGEGLVQEMAKDYIRNVTISSNTNDFIIGIRRPKLVTDEYLELLKYSFEEYPEYGIGGGNHAQTVIDIFKSTGILSVLDYGCGRGYLAKSLNFPIWEYDPAIPGKDEIPNPADLVVCTDVLEHVEPEKLDLVLDDLRRCVKKIGYFVISTRPAHKHLRDGRNAHLIIETMEWWKNKLEEFFNINEFVENDKIKSTTFIVVPKYNLNNIIKKND